MLYPWKPTLAVGFRCLPKCSEGTVQNNPGCSFELLISEGREQRQAICYFVSRDMISAVLSFGSGGFKTFCCLIFLLWSLGSSYAELTGSGTTVLCILGDSSCDWKLSWCVLGNYSPSPRIQKQSCVHIMFCSEHYSMEWLRSWVLRLQTDLGLRENPGGGDWSSFPVDCSPFILI